MSSTISAREEMKTKIQEEIIGEIKKELTDEFPKIRFWLPEERIDDDEILDTYPNIYNIYVTQPTFKPGNKKPVSAVLVGRNFDASRYAVLNNIYIGLTTDTVVYLKTWGRRASIIIHNYLNEKGDYHLKDLRFDLLPDSKKENFVIPNLPLENIHFYYPFGKSNKFNVIDTNKFLDEQIIANSEETKQADLQAAEAFRAMLQANSNKPSS